MGIEELENLSEEETLIVLYLLHNPDYGKNMANNFRGAESKGWWTRERGYSHLRLMNDRGKDKIYAKLTKLQSLNIIRERQQETELSEIEKRLDEGRGRVGRGNRREDLHIEYAEKRRKVYELNPQLFSRYFVCIDKDDLNKGMRMALIAPGFFEVVFILLKELLPYDSDEEGSKEEKLFGYLNRWAKYDTISLVYHLKYQLSYFNLYWKFVMTNFPEREMDKNTEATNKDKAQFIFWQQDKRFESLPQAKIELNKRFVIDGRTMYRFYKQFKPQIVGWIKMEKETSNFYRDFRKTPFLVVDKFPQIWQGEYLGYDDLFDPFQSVDKVIGLLDSFLESHFLLSRLGKKY